MTEVKIKQLYLPSDKDLFRKVDRNSELMKVVLLPNETPLALRLLTKEEKLLPGYKDKDYFVVGGQHRIFRLYLDMVLKPLEQNPKLSQEKLNGEFQEASVSAVIKNGLGSDVIL
jgi:hypothetical protein